MSSDFYSQVIEKLQQVPQGRVTTYSELARAIGRINAQRAVGNALNKNKDLINIPCYRVVRSDGRVGGYVSGQAKKIAMLVRDGIIIRSDRVQNLADYLYRFKQKA